MKRAAWTVLAVTAFFAGTSAAAGEPRIVVTPSVVIGANVHAAATLYTSRVYDEAGLFLAADAIADAPPTLPASAAAKVDRYRAARGQRVAPAVSEELSRGPADVVGSVLEANLASGLGEMAAYAELVADVAASLDEFMNDNVTPGSERDHLAADTQDAGEALGLTESNRAYGAAIDVDGPLVAHVVDAVAVLADPDVQKAYGARSSAELVAKLTGKSTSDVQRLTRRADAAKELLGVLAENAALLRDPKDRIALAKKVGLHGAAAKEWLATKPATTPAPTKRVVPLCFDAAQKLVPCTIVTQ